MKDGMKSMKKEFKNINIDQIEVSWIVQFQSGPIIRFVYPPRTFTMKWQT